MKVYLVAGKGHTSSIKLRLEVLSKDQTNKNTATALSKTTAL